MINFKGKKILITGATGGIGKALVKKFLSLDGTILATGTNTEKLNIKDPKNILISNVTGKEIENSLQIKDLLIKQIESRVRWRESVKYMIDNGVNNFVEIGPGKVLSGLIKRIDRNVKVSAINNEEDISVVKIND